MRELVWSLGITFQVIILVGIGGLFLRSIWNTACGHRGYAAVDMALGLGLILIAAMLGVFEL